MRICETIRKEKYLDQILSDNEFVCSSGGSRGGAWGTRSPLFLDQTEPQRAKKCFSEPPPPPLSQGLDPAP